MLDHPEIARRLRVEIARRRMSRQALADMAKLSLSTLEKALAGSRPFTLATVVRLEDALELKLRRAPAPRSAASADLAPESMGSYARAAVQWIEGDYLTLRPSFGEVDRIYAYRTRIAWDEGKGHLIFAESDRLDDVFSQSGFVSMPNLSGHTYLVTSESGQFRLVMLGRATRERRMFGLLSTLMVGAGSQLIPVSCPIAYVPIEPGVVPEFGLIRAGEPQEAPYRDILGKALSDDFCRLRG
ncbi:MAG: helix-turn-helix transcriptional regulator [Sphingomonadales bacterium]|nr:helix-turn-helix transcriptional regulator [Sphingomonadales bacterium]MBD3773920.1 helix-turn-helix transcriptional regulator [Paracoccaceae bacterium]